MFFYFKVSAKESQALKNFFRFISKLKTSPMIFKHFSGQQKRKFITILKSPHVNKTAQEQFEFRFYSKRFRVDSFKPLTFFLILKKIKNLSFPGIKVEIKGLFNVKEKNKNLLRSISPDSVFFTSKNNFKVKRQQQNLYFQKKYIQLFDYYGENYLKHSFYLNF